MLILLAIAALSKPALCQEDEPAIGAGSEWLREIDEEFGEDEPAEPLPPWPVRVRIDTHDGILSVDWWGDGRPPAWYPVEDLARFERARPWEGHPDELFVVLKDGTRILAARGAEVGSQSVLAPALCDRPLQDLSPGQGHLTPPSMSGIPGPTLEVGTVGGGLAIRALEPSGGKLGRPGEVDATVTTPPQEDDAPDLDGEGGGTLDRRAIDAEIRRRTNLFSRCYQRGLQRNPGLSGVVTTQFVIDRDGSVKGAWTEGSTLGDPAVEHCILEEIRQARFPAPQGGTVVVSYPLRF